MAITSANQLELLQTAEAVAREKMIDPDLVIQAMEESLARAAKSRYGSDLDIRVRIDRKTGRATFARIRTVVEDDAVENHHAQLTVKQAKSYKADAAVGDEIIDEVPPVDLGRIAAQSAKQVILQKVREAERDRQFEEFKDRKGSIINGVVKREEYGNIIVDIGRGEGILRRIVQASSREGDTVLDFFAGSGTTGAVAASLGRNFILIDQNPEALAVMRSRFAPLEGAVRFE